MTKLTDRLAAATTLVASIKNKQLFMDATIVTAMKDGRELVFLRGYDSDGIIDTVLLNSEPDFEATEYSAVLNIRISSKGKAAQQAVKLSKTEYMEYLSSETEANEII